MPSLPEGFKVVSKPSASLPEGFKVVEQPRKKTVLGAPVGEFLAGAVRGVTEGVDFFTAGPVNTVSRLAGSDFRVPTLTETVGKVGAGQGGFMEPGLARDTAAAAGNMAGGAGFGLVSAVKGIPSLFSSQSPVRQGIESLARDGGKQAQALVRRIESVAKVQSGDVALAGVTVSETGRLVKDTLAKNAIKQGFDEGVIAALKASTPESRQSMRRMVDILEAGKKNSRFGVVNRPSDIVGDAIQQRLVSIRKVNAEAGLRLNHEAKKLKGQSVDIAQAKNGFLKSLEELGVKIGDDGKLVFEGSQVKLSGAPKALDEIFGRINNFSGDAYEAHKLKQFISNQVEFGKKSKKPITADAERALKSLRHDLNEVLRAASDNYKKQNDIYSETIDALKAFEKSAGQSLDILKPNAEKAIGTSARKLMSNQQSRVAMLNALDDLENLVAKHGVKPKDDILTMVLFADELDAVFKPAARTSLAGDVSKAAQTGVSAASGDTMGLVRAGVDKGVDLLRNVNEDEALKSIKALLSR